MSEKSQNTKAQQEQEKGHAAHTHDAAAKGLDGKMDRPIKVTMMGAGSGFTPRLTNDILSIPGNRGGTIALVDVDEQRLGVMHKLLENLIIDRGYENWKVLSSKDRR